jgi:hypothetical protein
MKKNITYYYTLLVISLVSCSKSDWDRIDQNLSRLSGPYISTVNFYTPALEIIELPANRYFIYKDQATGSLDSVVVTQSMLETKFQAQTQNTLAYSYSTYTLSMNKISGSAIQSWYTGFATCDFPGSSTIISVIDSTFNLSNGSTDLPAFWYPLASSGNLQYSNIPLVSIEGNTYLDVYSFSATNGFQPTESNYLATTFWWVKGIGIIKRETRTFNSIKTSLLLRYG